MNPLFTSSVVKTEIYHRSFHIDEKHNIDILPEQPAVFGIFAIVNETPVHPRVVGSTLNLRLEIKKMYEDPPNQGMKHFMQGSFIQMLCYQTLEGISDNERLEKEARWKEYYNPGVTDEGEYPNYSYDWPYEENGELKKEYINPTLPNL